MSANITKSGTLQKVEGQNVLLSEETTVYLVDVSGSMGDVMGERQGKEIRKDEAVRLAMEAVLETRVANPTADKVGIVTFGGSYSSLTEVLLEPRVIELEHMKLLSRIGHHNDTPMYAGLERGARLLAEAQGLVRIVLLSDGWPNQGGGKSDVKRLAEKLGKEYGIIIDCVGIGVPNRTPSYDQDFMKEVAKLGSGEFYPIDDIDQLVKRLATTATERKMLLGGGVMLLGDMSQSF